jgi:hypothetical protein
MLWYFIDVLHLFCPFFKSGIKYNLSFKLEDEINVGMNDPETYGISNHPTPSPGPQHHDSRDLVCFVHPISPASIAVPDT